MLVDIKYELNKNSEPNASLDINEMLFDSSLSTAPEKASVEPVGGSDGSVESRCIQELEGMVLKDAVVKTFFKKQKCEN